MTILLPGVEQTPIGKGCGPFFPPALNDISPFSLSSSTPFSVTPLIHTPLHSSTNFPIAVNEYAATGRALPPSSLSPDMGEIFTH
jgi:hypothetical protein